MADSKLRLTPFLTGYVSKCRQKMRFSYARRADQDRTAKRLNELAIKEAKYLLFGGLLWKRKVIVRQRLHHWYPQLAPAFVGVKNPFAPWKS